MQVLRTRGDNFRTSFLMFFMMLACDTNMTMNFYLIFTFCDKVHALRTFALNNPQLFEMEVFICFFT